MAAKKKPYNSLSKSGKFYRDNPKSYAKKREYSKTDEKKPENVKSRVELITAHRKRKKSGKSCGKDKDLAHVTRGGKKTLVCKNYKKNRGSKSDSSGDKRARGGKRKKK
jgi:hypothetical protein